MTPRISTLVGSDNYFEHFAVGDRFRHARGKTVTEMDGVLITNLVMNTAQGHFNEHVMADREFGRRIVFGGVTASIVIGLASQDTAENALAELGMTGVRFRSPVFHGDTLYASTEVVATGNADRPDAGVVTFDHIGHNQHGEVVFTGQRRVLLKRASHWAER
ncbi:MaoC family dehydratase [Pseudonocardia acidicola]|uniref:MaoC family dehydratase n=1 Tax=Pseudonocardia acidicola TaxID=2724939 RepID=A0ABX1S6I2_9PSEU|nr:MaoC family dehydratase [Pseudonocardia acidicola]NMH96527.1 MaoC family dehydratase [Pseudonocardia acidicola]